MEANELFPSLERSLVRSLAGLMMTICLMLPLSRTGSVCLTSSGSAGRRVKGCPWAAREKGMDGLGECWRRVRVGWAAAFCVRVPQLGGGRSRRACEWIGREFENGNGEARS